MPYKKVIGIIVYAMKCTKCHAAHKNCSPVEEHDCPLNYVGSSKGMEAKAALEMVTAIFTEHNGRIFVFAVVSDDDSTMRAKVSHESSNIHGKLPLHIPQPIFKPDPGHRIKSMSKPFFEFAKAAKAISTIEMGDAMQYRMYIGCCIKKIAIFQSLNLKPKCVLRLNTFLVAMNGVTKNGVGVRSWKIRS